MHTVIIAEFNKHRQSRNNVYSVTPSIFKCQCDQIFPLTEAAHWLICSNVVVEAGSATWACATLYVSKQAIHGKGGQGIGRCACTCHVCMCVLVWRAWVCCVGGLIRRSHERQAPVSSREGQRYGWRSKRRGDAIVAPAPTSSFTFFCTWVGGRVCLSLSLHTRDHPIHSQTKPLSHPMIWWMWGIFTVHVCVSDLS